MIPVMVFSVFSITQLMPLYPSLHATVTARIVSAKLANLLRMMAMVVADRQGRVAILKSIGKTGHKVKMHCVLLLCFAFSSFALGQLGNTDLDQAQAELDNGNYISAIALAERRLEKSKRIKNGPLVSRGLEIIAGSQISLEKYDEAEVSLSEALKVVGEKKSNSHEVAQVYLRFVWLRRSQRRFPEALAFLKKALAITPDDRQMQAEYNLNIGRILFASGFDVSAIIWLEKSEKLLEHEAASAPKLDTYRFLTLAWSNKLNYQVALKYAEKWTSVAEGTPFGYKYRQALFETATILSASGQEGKALHILTKGLELSIAQNAPYQACNFLTSLLLHALDANDMAAAANYLDRLERLDIKKQFSFEVTLGKAVISAFTNRHDISEKLFAQLDKMESSSEFILLYWKIEIAERDQNWEQVIGLSKDLLQRTEESNFLDGLPGIYLTFAKAYFRLNQPETSLASLEKCLGYIEELRGSGNINLSLGLLDTYHDSYRLLAQIKSATPQESFELADFLKARLLKDRITNLATRTPSTVSPAVRQKLEELSLKYIGDQSATVEIERTEKVVSNAVPDLNLAIPHLVDLDRNTDLNDTAVVSYFFTLDKRLLAFVWEKDKPLKTIYLPVTEEAAETDAKTTQQKIKNFIYFKRDAKVLFDKLLKPLSISAKHLIVIPDKFLWRIPFQALSPDGEKYLIEDKVISYAPSVSILLELLRNPISVRQTLQAFANSSYNNKLLQNVNAEATRVSGLFNSRPVLNASVADFRRLADKADILHFSMHAQVDSDQPLDSFLGFRAVGKDGGRLTVENLLSTRLRKGGLVFLASCDTNNVLSGEGLVSLAWGMMGSGATTVVSAQWEADDKLTGTFATAFYRSYKKGFSAAEALQKASQEMIRNKSNNMHEPYFWADFTLNGDYR
jgi:CHAT domain-containing protein